MTHKTHRPRTPLLALLQVVMTCYIASCQSDFEQVATDELTKTDAPGAIVAIQIAQSKPILFAIGYADADSKTPMTVDMHMKVASVAKPFIGNAVLLLQDQGKLAISDPISKYVKGVPDGEKITLEQLANNTSGLFNSIENKDFQRLIVLDPSRIWQPREILAFAFAKEPYNAPADKWRYSNTNAVLLGEVIRTVSGQDYSQFIAEHVCSPLAVTSTTFLTEPSLPQPSPKGYRFGYKEKWLGYGDTWYEVTSYSASWSGAAGNLGSTASDLIKAAKPLAKGALLSVESRNDLHRFMPSTQAETDYGFAIGKYREWVGHTGDVPGFSSFMGYHEPSDTSLVVLTNLSNNKDGTSPAVRLRDALIDMLQKHQ
jgi:D-alanyl-D-alanine carboxypeptidase